MIKYILKRLFIIIPTLFLISVVAFYMSRAVPTDSVKSLLALRGLDDAEPGSKMYSDTYKELNYNLPNFYFSVKPDFYPEHLNSYDVEYERDIVKMLVRNNVHKSSVDDLLLSYKEKRKTYSEEGNSAGLIGLEQARSDFKSFVEVIDADHKSIDKSRVFLPKVRFHGTSNQYHRWLVKVFTAEFGTSIIDGRTALSKVKKALMWTLSFTLIDYIISLILGIGIGFYLASDQDNRVRKTVRQVLYFFYSLPLFWLATVLVVYFTTDDYGHWSNIFPSVGMDIYPGKSTAYQITHNLDKLILPIICLGLHSMAYVSRMVENSLRDEFRKDYVLLAFSEGKSRTEVLKQEVFRNALVPIITFFTSAFAAAFSGSLVLEVIFNIPGMGRLLFNSISMADWDVTFCILIIVSIVTVITYLVADILYAVFNPRIKFDS